MNLKADRVSIFRISRLNLVLCFVSLRIGGESYLGNPSENVITLTSYWLMVKWTYTLVKLHKNCHPFIAKKLLNRGFIARKVIIQLWRCWQFWSTLTWGMCPTTSVFPYQSVEGGEYVVLSDIFQRVPSVAVSMSGSSSVWETVNGISAPSLSLCESLFPPSL